MKLKYSLIVVIALAMLVGCGTKNPYGAGTFLRGLTFEDNGKHREASEAYGAFVRNSPADSLSCEAQYRKGLCYMELEDYPLAIVEFQILRREYPVCGFVGDALYMEAESQFSQVSKPDLDIAPAIDARLIYRDFIDLYPDHDKVSEANAKLVEISDLIVKKRINKANTFVQLKRFEAAQITLERVLSTELDSSILDEVRVLLQQIKDAQVKLEE